MEPHGHAVRKTCYSCFRHQVTIRSVSEVIKIVGKYTATVCLAVILKKPLSCTSTVHNMVSEMETWR